MLLILLIVCSSQFIAGQSSEDISNYKLVWRDEFNNELIDTSKWILDNETNPNRNGELQYYTTRSKNIFLKDGKLFITAIKENYNFNGETREYTSAKLRTKGKAEWKYGKIVVRAKMPKAGNGTWPAIWMMPAHSKYGNWPNSGEIDIMEYVGYQPDSVFGTINSKSYNHIMGTERRESIYIPNLSDEFHNYSIEWNSEVIKFFADKMEYFRFNNEHKTWEEWPFDNEFYLIINLAIGGSWGGRKGINNKIFPSKMEVDFIRVYQKNFGFN